jgi:hypothetical protein
VKVERSFVSRQGLEPDKYAKTNACQRARQLQARR